MEQEKKKKPEFLPEFASVENRMERIELLEFNCKNRTEEKDYTRELTESEIAEYQQKEIESFNEIMRLSDEIKDKNAEKKIHTDTHREAHTILKAGEIREKGCLYYIQDTENEGLCMVVTETGMVLNRVPYRGDIRINFNMKKAV